MSNIPRNIVLIGASVSEPHISLFNCNFSYIYYILSVIYHAVLFQFHVYGHLMSFENQKRSEKVPEVISEGLKFKTFLGGGGMPSDPTGCAVARSPQKFT